MIRRFIILPRLRRARDAAQALYNAAAKRKDTRGMHEAYAKLYKALHALMAAGG